MHYKADSLHKPINYVLDLLFHISIISDSYKFSRWHSIVKMKLDRLREDKTKVVGKISKLGKERYVSLIARQRGETQPQPQNLNVKSQPSEPQPQPLRTKIETETSGIKIKTLTDTITSRRSSNYIAIEDCSYGQVQYTSNEVLNYGQPRYNYNVSD